MSRTDLLARAFDFRRAWSARQGHGATSSFGPADSLLLSILLDIERAPALAAPDGELRDALAQTFRSLERVEPLSLSKAGHRTATLRLVHFDQIGRGELEGVLYLVHDLPRSLPLKCLGRLADRRLIPFAFLSSATWSSRLALLTSSDFEADALDLVERLSEVLDSDELDPLSLYDEMQTLRATMPTGREGAADLVERCRELERRLRGLEISGLIRHQALLAGAARRRKLLS